MSAWSTLLSGLFACNVPTAHSSSSTEPISLYPASWNPKPKPPAPANKSSTFGGCADCNPNLLVFHIASEHAVVYAQSAHDRTPIIFVRIQHLAHMWGVLMMTVCGIIDV